MKNCIIHRYLVIAELMNTWNNHIENRKVQNALASIDQVIAEDPRVVILEHGDPADVVKHFKAGDEVMLYGAYREQCLQTAREALTKAGVKADYHPTGSILSFQALGQTNACQSGDPSSRYILAALMQSGQN